MDNKNFIPLLIVSCLITLNLCLCCNNYINPYHDLDLRNEPTGIRSSTPDLYLKEVDYSNNIIKIIITNQGNSSGINVILAVEIESIALELYNNTNNPFDLNAGAQIEVLIDLSDYQSYLKNGRTYIINMRLDPDNIINETNEINNNILDYQLIYNENASFEGFDFFIILIIIVGSVSAISGGAIYYLVYYKNKENTNLKLGKKKFFGKKKDLVKSVQRYKKKKKKKTHDKSPEIPLISLGDIDPKTFDDSEIGVNKSSFTCVVHRGPILGTNFICPKCQTIYCYKCAKTLKVNGEGCWSCHSELDIEITEQDKHLLLKQSVDKILENIVNNHPLYEDYIKTDKIFEDIPENNTYGFGFLEEEELKKINLLSLSNEEKIEFMGEILGLKYNERNRLLDKMVKYKHYNDSNFKDE